MGVMGASLQLRGYLLIKYKHTYVSAVEKVRTDYRETRAQPDKFYGTIPDHTLSPMISLLED